MVINEKTHKILRTLQWLIPDLLAFYGILDGIFGWGLVDTVETVVFAFVGLLGNIAQHSSDTYFKGKEIVDKTEE